MASLKDAMATAGANEKAAPCLSKWRHLKSGGEYIVMGHVIIEATLEPAIVYRHAYDETYSTPIWCRPAAEFFDGRFESADEGASER